MVNTIKLYTTENYNTNENSVGNKNIRPSTRLKSSM